MDLPRTLSRGVGDVCLVLINVADVTLTRIDVHLNAWWEILGNYSLLNLHRTLWIGFDLLI